MSKRYWYNQYRGVWGIDMMEVADIKHCKNIVQLRKLQTKLMNGGYNLSKKSAWEERLRAIANRLEELESNA